MKFSAFFSKPWNHTFLISFFLVFSSIFSRKEMFTRISLGHLRFGFLEGKKPIVEVFAKANLQRPTVEQFAVGFLAFFFCSRSRKKRWKGLLVPFLSRTSPWRLLFKQKIIQQKKPSKKCYILISKKCEVCEETIVLLAKPMLYRSVQNETSKVLHRYAMNEFLIACRSRKTKNTFETLKLM